MATGKILYFRLTFVMKQRRLTPLPIKDVPKKELSPNTILKFRSYLCRFFLLTAVYPWFELSAQKDLRAQFKYWLKTTRTKFCFCLNLPKSHHRNRERWENAISV